MDGPGGIVVINNTRRVFVGNMNDVSNCITSAEAIFLFPGNEKYGNFPKINGPFFLIWNVRECYGSLTKNCSDQFLCKL